MTEQARTIYLKEMVTKSKAVLNGLKVPYKKRTPVNVGSFKSHYGVCYNHRHPDGKYTFNIEIAKWLIDTKNDDAIINTIIHEYLHTIDPKAHHGGSWKMWATVVSNNTPYNIQRTSSYEEKGVETQVPHKYKAVCTECGDTYYFNRMCKFIKNHGKGYHCGKCKNHGFKFYDAMGNEI